MIFKKHAPINMLFLSRDVGSLNQVFSYHEEILAFSHCVFIEGLFVCYYDIVSRSILKNPKGLGQKIKYIYQYVN